MSFKNPRAFCYRHPNDSLFWRCFLPFLMPGYFGCTCKGIFFNNKSFAHGPVPKWEWKLENGIYQQFVGTTFYDFEETLILSVEFLPLLSAVP